VRWQALFDDFEAQLSAADAADHAAEVADRTRRERALVRLADRLRPEQGRDLLLRVAGAGDVRGRLLEVGVDWLLLEEQPGRREVLVPEPALLSVSGVGPGSAVPGSEGEVARRLDLRWALRGLVRSRSGVVVVLRDGTIVSGTLDAVGADHVDVAEHPPGEPRRASAVTGVRVVPVAALALVRSAGATG
jgi:hypothetical protein